MPTPTSNWHVVANCEEADLTLVFEVCNATGSAALVEPASLWTSAAGSTVLSGFWNEEAQKLTFVKMQRDGDVGDARTIQVFTGYLMHDPVTDGPPCAMAGTFEAFRQSFLTATVGVCERCVFGWYAMPQR